MFEPISVPILAAGPFYRAPKTVQTTLAVRPTPAEPVRKITKVIGYGDGGFGLLAPYHEAKSGFITKTLIDYRTQRPVDQDTESFSASDRVKLSYHPDGFVQFSGENPGRIVSGRDALTGEPKGLGFMTNPMNTPVSTGPAFGIHFWGLDDFQIQKGKPRGDLVIFEEGDFVYEHCDKSTWGSYGFSFFIFGLAFQQYVRRTGTKSFEIDLWMNQFMRDGAAFKLKVIRLGEQPWFLGAAAFRRPRNAGNAVPPSGWIIGSPGAATNTSIKPVMHAHYPDAGIELERSVDYELWTTNAADAADVGGQFGRDYRALLSRAEAELSLRSPRQVPVLEVIQEGTALLAQILDGILLQPLQNAGPEATLRAVVSILTALSLRTARALNLLIAAGYVPEAASTVGRLQSLQRVIRQVREDPSGETALRLLTGVPLRDLDPEGWRQAREAMEAHLTQMPGLTTISAGPTVRPGLGFAGQREPQREAVQGGAALVAIANIAGDAFLVLRGEYAPASLKVRLHKFRSDALRQIELADKVAQAATEPAPDTQPSDTEPIGVSTAPTAQAIRAAAALAHAQTLRGLGDHTGARRQLEEAIDAKDPQLTPMAQFQLGNACRDLGDVSAARKAYEAAAEAGLNISASAAYNLGHLLATLDPPASKAAYAQAMELDPIESGPKAAVNLGIALAGDGNAESARRAFQWAINSGHPVQRAKAFVNLAQLTVASGDVAGAVRLLEEAIEADVAGVTSKALLIRGDLHLSAHEADDAAVAYARAITYADSPVSGEAALRLAYLEHQAGRDEDARGHYEQAVELGPEAVAVSAGEALATLDS